MPIYEYECANCHHRLEALQKVSDPALSECPACQRPDLKKLVSAASFRLKGGGWYETDFKTGDKKQLAKSESNESGADGDQKASSTTKASEGADKGAAGKSTPAEPANKSTSASKE